ncbi:MAG: hypothetical protein AAGC55_08180 [Myxococcota bacterium]
MRVRSAMSFLSPLPPQPALLCGLLLVAPACSAELGDADDMLGGTPIGEPDGGAGPSLPDFAPSHIGAESFELGTGPLLLDRPGQVIVIDTDGLGIITSDGAPLMADGVAFTVVEQGSGVPEIAVLAAARLEITATTQIEVIGGRALAMAIAGEVRLAGEIVATGGRGAIAAAGPGGFPGGDGAAPDGSGPGGGAYGGDDPPGDDTSNDVGGGGGGHGRSGGQGGDRANSLVDGGVAPGGAGGSAYDDEQQYLIGGSGGGRGGGLGGVGGGGGGAVQISAAVAIAIDPGSIINVGGGGGRSNGGDDGGGGGGAGGMIVIEAPVVTIDQGVLAGNGGGGGSGSNVLNPGRDGATGLAASEPAGGGLQTGEGMAGGDGGAAGAADGQPGGDSAGIDGTDDNGGGGGGGVGRIVVRASSLSQASAVISPDFERGEP